MNGKERERERERERESVEKKIFSFFVELLSGSDTPRVVKLLGLFGVSHRDVSSDDKHGTVAVKNRCLGCPAQLARMLHYYTGLKLTAQHSMNTTKTTT
jgi:hypothetical protein